MVHQLIYEKQSYSKKIISFFKIVTTKKLDDTNTFKDTSIFFFHRYVNITLKILQDF